MYGTDPAQNAHGQLTEHYDEAGRLHLTTFDFKGNVLEKSWQVVADEVFTNQWAKAAAQNWAALPAGFNAHWDDLTTPAARLAPRAYVTSSTFDGLNRATELRLPAEPGRGEARPVLRPTYNRAGALAQVSLDGEVLIRQLAYNARGQRLLLARGNGLLTRYAYDKVMFRLLRLDAADQLRQFATWTEAGAAPTLLAYYLYSGGQRVKKLTQTGADTWQVTVYGEGGFEHRYTVSQGARTGEQTQLAGLDGQHRLHQRRSGDALGDQRPASLYALDDHLGSAAALTDTSGQLVSREEYYPFGETSFGSSAKQRYRFCGKELDEESGLCYYGMRYYAAWLCRFVSVDPLAAKYTYYTPYQYAGNRPINFIDLDGAEPALPGGGGNVARTLRPNTAMPAVSTQVAVHAPLFRFTTRSQLLVILPALIKLFFDRDLPPLTK